MSELEHAREAAHLARSAVAAQVATLADAETAYARSSELFTADPQPQYFMEREVARQRVANATKSLEQARAEQTAAERAVAEARIDQIGFEREAIHLGIANDLRRAREIFDELATVVDRFHTAASRDSSIMAEANTLGQKHGVSVAGEPIRLPDIRMALGTVLFGDYELPELRENAALGEFRRIAEIMLDPGTLADTRERIRQLNDAFNAAQAVSEIGAWLTLCPPPDWAASGTGYQLRYERGQQLLRAIERLTTKDGRNDS